MNLAPGAVPEISATELAAVLGTPDAPALLDVREPEEFDAWAMAGARNVPLSRLALEIDDVVRDREVVVICASGSRSARAVEALRSSGIPARNLAGGMLAWAAVYDTAILELGAARIVQVRRRGKGCLSYVVGAKHEAFVVDPSLDVDRYLDVAKQHGWRITRVFDTHLHADHLSGVRALASATGASVHLNPADGYRFSFHPLDDDQWFSLGGQEHFVVTVLHSPGHTPGSTIYEVGGRALLTGDTLFVDGVGRPDLADHAEAFARELHRSLHTKAIAMPVDATVLPAHYGEAVAVTPHAVVGASLGDLRSSLPQLSWPEDRFVEWASGRARPRPPHYREIVSVNAGATPAPLVDELRRLELGPNRCAA
ncbi:MAG: MBL fold metallo-hydrolase [Actinomycetota bacterium]|nr:MBL fold metallo-hydrolase [Actinomycetota bacterium]